MGRTARTSSVRRVFFAMPVSNRHWGQAALAADPSLPAPNDVPDNICGGILGARGSCPLRFRRAGVGLDVDDGHPATCAGLAEERATEQGEASEDAVAESQQCSTVRVPNPCKGTLTRPPCTRPRRYCRNVQAMVSFCPDGRVEGYIANLG